MRLRFLRLGIVVLGVRQGQSPQDVGQRLTVQAKLGNLGSRYGLTLRALNPKVAGVTPLRVLDGLRLQRADQVCSCPSYPNTV